MNEKKTHATCSASGASRWLACPGSVALTAHLPPEIPSKYALEGTKAHELAEDFLVQIIEKNLTHTPPDWWITTVKDNYSEEMIQHVITYVSIVMEEFQSFDKEPSMRIESKLTLDKDLNLYGTADVAMTGLKNDMWCGSILDLKYGKSKVIAHNNPQLAYYACAMRKTSKNPLEKIKVSIIQPRIKHSMTEIEYSRIELDEWENKLLDGANKALLQVGVPSMREFKLGEHCKWCKGISICPEKNKLPGLNEGLEFLE